VTLRVLHLDHTTVAGGAEFALLRTLLAPHSWNARVVVAGSRRKGVYDPLGQVLRFRGVQQPVGASGAGAVAILPAAARLAAQAVATRTDPVLRTADIVHANTARAAAYAAVALRWSRVPFVVHIRDLVEPDALGGLGYGLMTRLVLPRADGVIGNSRAALASSRPHLSARAIARVIPSPIGALALPDPSARDDSKPQVLRVGMLARIDPWKGQAILLEAFAAALGRSEAVLEFAGAPLFGQDDHLAQLRRRARELGISERVVFLGHVDDVGSVVGRWDIAVQASTRAEPLGQNVLQYLAAGRAVVVADEGGPTEWVEDGINGLRFVPRDEASLSRVLRRLADDRELRARLGDAAATTPGLLSDAEVAVEQRDFYDELLRTLR